METIDNTIPQKEKIQVSRIMLTLDLEDLDGLSVYTTSVDFNSPIVKKSEDYLMMCIDDFVRRIVRDTGMFDKAADEKESA